VGQKTQNLATTLLYCGFEKKQHVLNLKKETYIQTDTRAPQRIPASPARSARAQVRMTTNID